MMDNGIPLLLATFCDECPEAPCGSDDAPQQMGLATRDAAPWRRR